MKPKSYSLNKKDFIWLVKVFLLWRLWLFFLGWLGIKLLPFKYSFPYVEHILKPYGNELLWSWANFDGVHYLLIAQKGYIAQGTQAFFPLYPLLIRFLNLFFRNFLISGLIISHLSFFFASLLFYKLIFIDYSKKIAKATITFLLLFPTSFFFAAYYTESLFFLLLTSFYYFLRRDNFFKASFIAFFATMTKLIGIFLTPVLFFYFYKKYKIKPKMKNREFLKKIIFSFFPILALLGYMFYLNKNYGDPLFFIHAQATWGASRSVDKLILLYQVFYRYFKMIFTFNLDKFFYFTLFLEFFSGLIFLILLIWVYFKKINKIYLLFAVPAYFLPTFTGTFSSMPRYVLVLFPCFIVLGTIQQLFFKRLLYLISFILLAISTILFTRGYWVS